MKLDWDTGLGSTDADRSVWVVQPVIPISINDNWNIISRTVIPAWIDVGRTTAGGSSASGIGDTYGALVNQLWSLNDDDSGNSSSTMFLQPFFDIYQQEIYHFWYQLGINL